MKSLTELRRPLTLAAALAVAGAAAVAACSSEAPTDQTAAGAAAATERVTFGAPVALGNGQARTYLVTDRLGAPVEIGIAMDSAGMEGLPAPMPEHDGTGHVDMHEYLLPLPAQNPTPFRLVELDWNPAGHEPAGIYDKPHFDFHFYTITEAERNAIDPSDPQYGAKAANYPAADLRWPGFLDGATLGGVPAGVAAVPRMGMHWIDPTSPELPPQMKPFTTTLIQGTWDGKVIFQEPMITRAYILSRPQVTIPMPAAQRYEPAGYYPTAYKIQWHAAAKQYRIAFAGMELKH